MRLWETVKDYLAQLTPYIAISSQEQRNPGGEKGEGGLYNLERSWPVESAWRLELHSPLFTGAFIRVLLYPDYSEIPQHFYISSLLSPSSLEEARDE